METGKNKPVVILIFLECKSITLREEYTTYVVYCQLIGIISKVKFFIEKLEIVFPYDNGSSLVGMKTALHCFVNSAKTKIKKGEKHNT